MDQHQTATYYMHLQWKVNFFYSTQVRLNVINGSDVKDWEEGWLLDERDDIFSAPEGLQVPRQFSFDLKATDIIVNHDIECDEPKGETLFNHYNGLL